ncbi:replication A protein-like [Arabidopsis thaliana]|nr:replication A protein-like [Arabidopsis thaliana]CAB78915.1 replication A protein-like [Arabidopsis thaliana]
MMEVSLTAGAIGKIMNGEVTTEADMIPVLQVTDLKQIMAQQDPTRERFRMVLSDGTYLHQGMLGTDLNNLVKEGTLQPGSIVRLTRFVGDVIKGRRIVIVPQLEVLKQISDIIGHPVPGGKHNDQRGADSGIKFNTTEQQGSGIRQVNNIEPGRSNAAISPQVGAPPKIIPVNALSPYSGRWTIKARVTNKAALKQYSNPRGEGKVFNFDLLDADGGEIRVTCFNAVADQFYDQIVVGNLYLISRGSLRPAQKNFNHLRNDYEIMLDNASTIKQCYEEDAAIPRHQFHFRTIGDIESMENNCIVDVIGIVSSISPTVTITRKNGTATPKRSLQLKDMSGRSVEVTMWGDFQSLCDSGVFPVLAVKAGRISEFNGKTVSTIGSSQLFIDPDFVEAEKLKNWFEREGKSVPCISLSREFSGSGKVDVRKTISQIKDEKLGTSEKPDWITVSATILYLKFDNFCYTACPIMNGDRPCSKKVTDNGDGTWRCEKCDKSVDECDYRYILQLQIQDHTDLTCVTAFQEAGEEIMGISAKDLYYVKNEHKDEEKFEDIIRKVAFTKYNFKLKVKEETFSDEQRVKATVVKVDKLNYSADTRTMLGAMDKLRTRDANSLPINPEGSDYNADVVNTGIGSSGTRDPSSVQRRDFGLHAHQSGQSGNHYSGGGATTSCNVCGNSGHVSAKCPGATKPQEQGQYMGGSYRGTTGSYGGGLPRQHVGSY